MRNLNTIYVFLFSLFFFNYLNAQSVVISGTVNDRETGESLIGVTVYVLEEETGTVTNEYGYYQIGIPKSQDSLTIRFSYVGYQDQIIKILADKGQSRNITLGSGIDLSEVVVSANADQERVQNTQMSVTNVTIKEAKMLPALFGEVDIIKTIQLKPGIQSGSEGTSGLIVRGGGPDQNLILLDEAVVYNPNHLFGFFSTFNSDAIKDLKVYKGGFPAEYGGRLSSVLDVRLKDGNIKKFSASGGIGLITSRLTLEVPVVKDKSSIVISGRRTYIDLFTNLLNKSNEGKEDYTPIPGYNFYDLNVKANYKLSDKDQLFISGYFGRDQFAFDSDDFNFGFDWGNATVTARWNRAIRSNLFVNTTLVFSDYNYDTASELPGFDFSFGSRVRDYSFKNSYLYAIGSGHDIKAGWEVTSHQFSIGRLRGGDAESGLNFNSGESLSGVQMAAYISDDWKISRRMNLYGGLRVSGFTGNNSFYVKPEPRLAARYSLSPGMSLKASYARMHQYVHLISNSGISLPTDVWYPSTEHTKPQQSDQVALGFSTILGKDFYFEVEGYYKWLENQLEFKDNANLFLNDDLENEFAFGRGYSTGAEITLEKKEGKLQGWIGYTLAWIKRGEFSSIDGTEIMEGRYFSPRFDRRHDLSAVLMYELAKRWTVTTSFVYGSGDLTWLPSGRAYFQNIPGEDGIPLAPVFGDRNTIRMPAYHRMDVGIVFKSFHKWGESDLTLSIYNVYDRRNPYFLYLDTEFKPVELAGEIVGELPSKVSAKQVSLFPILPSITWNFKF